MVSIRDRPFYSIKAPKPNVSNRTPHYLAQNRTYTTIILQLAENHPIDYRS
ncbi:MAG: hypothetical protein ACBR15_04025 [Microcoleus sp.]